MVKSKACLKCRSIFEGDKCPECGDNSFSDSFKGEVVIFNPEKSFIANHMKITKKGKYAIKTR